MLVLALAMFGVGRSISPLPVDPSLVLSLPKLPPAPPERLGDMPRYAEVSERSLFSEDRRPEPFFLSEEEAAAPAFDLILSSVLITPVLELAIVQSARGGEGVRVKKGDAAEGFPNWRLIELSPRRAMFDGPEGLREFELRIFNGAGGQLPRIGGGTSVARPTAMGHGELGNAKAAVPPQMGNNAASKNLMSSLTSTSAERPRLPSASPTAPAPHSIPPLPTTTKTDQEINAICQHVEQRRAQLRQQQANPNPSPATSGKTK